MVVADGRGGGLEDDLTDKVDELDVSALVDVL